MILTDYKIFAMTALCLDVIEIQNSIFIYIARLMLNKIMEKEKMESLEKYRVKTKIKELIEI